MIARVAVAQGVAGYWLAHGEQLGVFVSLGIFFFVWFGFVLLIKLSLSQHTSFLTFTLLILSPIPLGREVSKGLCGAEVPTGV